MADFLISIVLPCYREEKNLTNTLESIIKVLNRQTDYAFEIILVNDGSPDHTWNIIEVLCDRYPFVKGINLSKNFGKELALTAGIEHATWVAIITIDADGQHPVDKIPLFLEKWKQGYDIVYNKRPKIQWAGLTKRLSSYCFYTLFNLISDFKLEPGTTDFRLLDRKVVDIFLKFKERSRIFRGIIDYIWFSKYALIFDALPNPTGRKPSYNYLKLLDLAINSITSFSVFPLKMVWYLGLLITIGSIWVFFIMMLDKLWILNLGFSNLAIVVVINTILIWIVLMSLWMMALYIAKIHQEVVWRPLYIVKDKKNF